MVVKMNKKVIIGILIAILIVIGVVVVYKVIEKSVTNRENFKYTVDNISSTPVDTVNNENLIYEKTITPNENFVSKEEDKVFYTIKIYQNNNEIRVVSSSNSSFSKDISYVIENNNKITENDINIEWQTIMGDTNFTEKNQIAVAVISIYSNGEIISQRKVNFISKAVDIVVDTINK